jgi:hypothetical protein
MFIEFFRNNCLRRLIRRNQGICSSIAGQDVLPRRTKSKVNKKDPCILSRESSLFWRARRGIVFTEEFLSSYKAGGNTAWPQMPIELTTRWTNAEAIFNLQNIQYLSLAAVAESQECKEATIFMQVVKSGKHELYQVGRSWKPHNALRPNKGRRLLIFPHLPQSFRRLQAFTQNVWRLLQLHI